jgi:hypothetical protein
MQLIYIVRIDDQHFFTIFKFEHNYKRNKRPTKN